jgi:hypothetical protein
LACSWFLEELLSSGLNFKKNGRPSIFRSGLGNNFKKLKLVGTFQGQIKQNCSMILGGSMDLTLNKKLLFQFKSPKIDLPPPPPTKVAKPCHG